jgi:hypothetical protein
VLLLFENLGIFDRRGQKNRTRQEKRKNKNHLCPPTLETLKTCI